MKSNWMPAAPASTLMLCVVLSGLTACGYFGKGHSSAAAPATAAAPTAAGAPRPQSDADMVAAMSPSKGDGHVTLKFALRQHPEVGQAAELDLQVTPTASVDRVTISLRADDGLTLSDGAHWDAIERPEVGVPFGHSLTIVPSRDGIFSVMVTVLTDTETQSVTRVFVIPVIAGAGIVAEAIRTPAASAKGAESTRGR